MVATEVTTQIHARLVVEQADRAIELYTAVYGAELLERYADTEGVVVHAALRIGVSVFSLTEQVCDWGLLAPTRTGGSPVLLHLTLPDPDDACARMVAHGGDVVIRIEDRHYGKREGRVRDPFGHLWILSRPLADTREP